MDDREPMAAPPFTVRAGGRFCWVADIDDGLIERAAFAAEKFFRDAGEVRF